MHGPGEGRVAQRVAEPELADSAPILRHRKLAAIGWSQTAKRLVAYLERGSSRRKITEDERSCLGQPAWRADR
jgi:hypothetical protein